MMAIGLKEEDRQLLREMIGVVKNLGEEFKKLGKQLNNNLVQLNRNIEFHNQKKR